MTLSDVPNLLDTVLAHRPLTLGAALTGIALLIGLSMVLVPRLRSRPATRIAILWLALPLVGLNLIAGALWHDADRTWLLTDFVAETYYLEDPSVEVPLGPLRESTRVIDGGREYSLAVTPEGDILLVDDSGYELQRR